MDHRGLYKFAGRSALGYAALSLASYLAWIYGSGFLAASSTVPSPDRLVQLAQAPGNQLSARLDIGSYFLLIPALLGIFAYLRDRVPERAQLGGAFAVFGLVALFVASSINATMMTLARGPVDELLRGRFQVLFQLSSSSMMPGLYAMAASNLFWGLALRGDSGLARHVGTLLLTQIAGFFLATAGFIAGSDMAGNSGILIQVLAGVATFALAGWWLRGLSEDEPVAVPSPTDKARVARA